MKKFKLKKDDKYSLHFFTEEGDVGEKTEEELIYSVSNKTLYIYSKTKERAINMLNSFFETAKN